jgi:hypothetical protein
LLSPSGPARIPAPHGALPLHRIGAFDDRAEGIAFTVDCHVAVTVVALTLRMRRFVQTDPQDIAIPARTSFGAANILRQLEDARALIETRFSDAGERLASSLDMVGSLIESLDRLGVTLNAQSVSHTTDELLSTAAGLTALPDAQRGRLSYLNRLKGAGAALEVHIDEMRTTLRYLRAFALNVKITAGSTIRASDEFAGFAESMCDQLDLGVSQLNELADQLTHLIVRLEEAEAFEQGLDGKYKALIPAVPEKLVVDARAIGLQHTRIAEVARSVSSIARDIQTKVGKALVALQIGDITRQRIEHVQRAIEVTEAMVIGADIPSDARDRAERRLLHMVADQMADTASDFETEAMKVTQSLSGMARDTTDILSMHTLSSASDEGGLRDLEMSLGKVSVLIGDVSAAMANADRISSETVSAVDALSRRVDTIHRVKRDIQQMAINSSLRCNRLGDIGKPLSVIAWELGSHASQLEGSADQTLGSLKALADLAGGMNSALSSDEKVDAARLEEVRDHLRRAADVVEHDLAGLGSHGQATAHSLALAADQLGLKEDLGDVLHTAAIALAEAAGPVVEDLTGIREVVDAAMAEIARCYTMGRERQVHALHAIQGETDDAAGPADTPPEAGAAAEEFDDILF